MNYSSSCAILALNAEKKADIVLPYIFTIAFPAPLFLVKYKAAAAGGAAAAKNSNKSKSSMSSSCSSIQKHRNKSSGPSGCGYVSHCIGSCPDTLE